jgi:hypothetical protein
MCTRAYQARSREGGEVRTGCRGTHRHTDAQRHRSRAGVRGRGRWMSSSSSSRRDHLGSAAEDWLGTNRAGAGRHWQALAGNSRVGGRLHGEGCIGASPYLYVHRTVYTARSNGHRPSWRLMADG